MGCSPPGSLGPWNFPGKNTGAGCHFLLQGIFPAQGLDAGLPHCRRILYHLNHQGSPYMYTHTHIYRSLITKLCPTHCNPMESSPPGSSVHGISQARILEWVAFSFSRGSSRPRDRTHVSCTPALVGRFFTTEPPGKQPGEEANQCLKTKIEDSTQTGKFLKGESFGKQGQSFCYLLLCAGFF